MGGNPGQTSNGWQFSHLAGDAHTLASCMWATHPLIFFRLKALYLFYTIILYFLEAFWKWICFPCSCLRKPSRKIIRLYKYTFFFKEQWFSLFNLELEATEGPCGTRVIPSLLLAFFQRAQANLLIMSLESEDKVPDNMTQISLLFAPYFILISPCRKDWFLRGL